MSPIVGAEGGHADSFAIVREPHSHDVPLLHACWPNCVGAQYQQVVLALQPEATVHDAPAVGWDAGQEGAGPMLCASSLPDASRGAASGPASRPTGHMNAGHAPETQKTPPPQSVHAVGAVAGQMPPPVADPSGAVAPSAVPESSALCGQ
jgi:hypothetical protein